MVVEAATKARFLYRPPDGLLRRPLFSKRRLRLRTVDAERVFATFRPRRELVSAHDLAPRRIEQRLSPALISGAGRILGPTREITGDANCASEERAHRANEVRLLRFRLL